MADHTDTIVSEAHILRLQPELMEVVATHAPPEDLLALRLTCRDIHGKVQRTFAHIHFTEKAFLLTSERSMRALEDISRHAVFGKQMEKVILVAHTVPCGRLDEHRRASLPNGRPGGSREERIKYREGRKTHQLLLLEHGKYWDRSKWRFPLAEALVNFNRSQSSIKLSFSDQRGAVSPSPCGKKHLQRVLGYSDCFQPVNGGGTGIPLSAFRDIALGDGGVPRSFLCLRTLEIRVATRYGNPPEATDVDAFTAFLNNASMITGLSLSNEGGWSRLSEIHKRMRLTALEEVSLNSWVDVDDLVGLLKRHRATLKRVNVFVVSKVSNPPWTVTGAYDLFKEALSTADINAEVTRNERPFFPNGGQAFSATVREG